MKYGLIGYPIGHSLSPALFKETHPDLEYDLIETPDFEEAMAIFRRDYAAVNVTSPFKELAFGAADRADEKTAIIGAANILRKEADGSISAFNSDYSAVLQLLQGHLDPAEPRKVLVIGCGGAGKAAALASHDLGLETVVANRTFSRAVEFCRRTGCGTAAGLKDVKDIIGGCGAVIFTIPDPAGLAEIIDNSGVLSIEANYRNPSLSGRNVIHGEEWLKSQAESGHAIMIES